MNKINRGLTRALDIAWVIDAALGFYEFFVHHDIERATYCFSLTCFLLLVRLRFDHWAERPTLRVSREAR